MQAMLGHIYDSGMLSLYQEPKTYHGQSYLWLGDAKFTPWTHDIMEPMINRYLNPHQFGAKQSCNVVDVWLLEKQIRINSFQRYGNENDISAQRQAKYQQVLRYNGTWFQSVQQI